MRLTRSYEENMDRLFSIEREVLDCRKKEVMSTERVKTLTEEFELCKFENDHLVCAMENKGSEVREVRKVLEENEKLLSKYKAKYIGAVEKLDKVLLDFQMHIDKLPDPSSFDTLRGELEMLREENLSLTQRNAYLEEQMRQSQTQIQTECPIALNFAQTVLDRLEKNALSQIEELVRSYQSVEQHMLLVENETVDWRQKCDELESKYEYVVKENDSLKRKLDKCNADTSTAKKPSRVLTRNVDESYSNADVEYYVNQKPKIEQERKVLPKRHTVAENCAKRINTEAPINITLCAICAFNIKKNERWLKCIKCKGKLKRCEP